MSLPYWVDNIFLEPNAPKNYTIPKDCHLMVVTSSYPVVMARFMILPNHPVVLKLGEHFSQGEIVSLTTESQNGANVVISSWRED